MREQQQAMPGVQVKRGGIHDAKELTKSLEDIERHRIKRVKQAKVKRA